jgi:hypothetical protein
LQWEFPRLPRETSRIIFWSPRGGLAPTSPLMLKERPESLPEAPDWNGAVGVAQLVELLVVVPVAGSSPVAHNTRLKQWRPRPQ